MITRDAIKLVNREMTRIDFDGSRYEMPQRAYANKYGGRSKHEKTIDFARSVLVLSNMVEKNLDPKPLPEEINRIEKFLFIMHNAEERKIDYLRAKDDLKIQEIYRKY